MQPRDSATATRDGARAAADRTGRARTTARLRRTLWTARAIDPDAAVREELRHARRNPPRTDSEREPGETLPIPFPRESDLRRTRPSTRGTVPVHQIGEGLPVWSRRSGCGGRARAEYQGVE